MADSYVCSGAKLRCSMGTDEARLTVLPIRTVFLTGKPMANISDHLSMVNLAPFGRCRSLAYPATASATAAAQGSLTPMPCLHNTPFPWMGGKNDFLIKGQPALLKSSTCACMWGGTITLVDDGQSAPGAADMRRKPAESFSSNQSKSKKQTNPSIKQNNQIIVPLRVVDNSRIKNNATTQVYQAAGNGGANTSDITPYTEAEKHYKELLNIDNKKLEGLPASWLNAFNEAVKNINANYSKSGIKGVYSDVELAHNIYKLATNEQAKKLGFKNISYKMPHQVFDIADKVPNFLKKIPKKEFWDSFDKYIPLYTNIDKGAYFSPTYNCVVISMTDKDNVNRLKNSDWYKAGLLHHEFGHAYDFNHGWRNDEEFKTLFAEFKDEMKKSNIEQKLSDYIAEIKHPGILTSRFPYISQGGRDLTNDEVEKLMALSDSLQAANDDHKQIPPGGHDEDYYKSEEKQMAEFIAHMSENYWSGNNLYKKLAPETYKKMCELLKKRWNKPS